MFYATNYSVGSVIKHASESEAYYIKREFEGKLYLSRFDFNSRAAAWAAAYNPFTLTNYVFSAYIN